MRRLLSTAFAAAVLAGLTLALGGTAAYAHDERPTVPVSGDGHVPSYRTDGPALLVCKTDAADFAKRIIGFAPSIKTQNETLFAQCQKDGFRDLQAAVDAAPATGARIMMLPGLYQELPSMVAPTGACAHLDARYSAMGYQILSWEQQNQCPHNQNMVAVLGKKNIQIEGTGAHPSDVTIDGQYKILNGIRADRADGFYIRNVLAERTQFNAIYIMETDGFVIDNAIGRWNDEYGFLTFADDHGLYANCEAYGNGDSGIYPGAAHNINVSSGHVAPRYAIEVRDCYSHDNTLGYSGTAGDSVWAHDNTFTHNETGVSTDSAFPNHPGMPQNHALFERNQIADNNADYNGYVRDGTCTKDRAQRGYEHGVVCPSVGVPTGTGIINPGGNWNIWRDNYIFGNDYAGILTTWVPGFIRNANSWGAQFDTSHHNRYLGNTMGVTPNGRKLPNGMDFWWDGQGTDNCWQSARPAGTEPLAMPVCGDGWSVSGPGAARYVAEPIKIAKLYDCSLYDLNSQTVPAGCEWFGSRGLSRLDVQISAGEGVIMALLAVLLMFRPLRRSRLAALGAALGVAGAVVGVVGQAYEATPLSAVGFALLGGWWLAHGVALRHSGRGKLGAFTLILGVLALINAVDRSVWMLPWIPVPPSLIRALLQIVWVPFVLATVVRNRRLTAGGPAATTPADSSTGPEPVPAA
jgi:hypothetical protein